MDEKSTTSVDNPDLQAPNTETDNQPAPTGDNLDASKSTDTSSTDVTKTEVDTKTDDAPASFDDDIDEWIDKRGLPKPADDTQKQKYQDLRNEQREFTREQQAKKETENANNLSTALADVKKEVKTDDDDDEDLDDETAKLVKELKADRDAERTIRLQSEFYTTNKVTDEQHKSILQIIKEEIATGATPEEKMQLVDFWGDPKRLPTLLRLAKAQVAASTDTTAVVDEATRKERERIAKESESKSPNRNATSTTTSDKTEDQARLERFKARYNK